MLATRVDEVVRQYGLPGPAVAIESGLINLTFVVMGDDGTEAAIVQRLHPVFAAEVNLDIDAVTAHVAGCGLQTPLLLRTRDGAPWLDMDDGVWRALSYVPGYTTSKMESREAARSVGKLVGRFHCAVDSLSHDYAFARLDVHNTAAHLAKLGGYVGGAAAAAAEPSELSESSGPSEVIDAGRALGQEILAQADGLPPLGDLPRRHCHGDLKISNVRFAADDHDAAICLVDLDTVGWQTMAYELGDALRSWCNRSGEDVSAPRVDEDIFAAAMSGYRGGVGDMLTSAEWAAIVPGLETVCVELAARFCVDVFEDRYFGWNAQAFPSRRAHNLVRARGQLALAQSVAAQRGNLESLLRLP